MRGRRFPTVFVVTLLAAAVLTACGSDGGKSGDKGGPAVTAAGGATTAGSTQGGGGGGGSELEDGCKIVTAADAQAVFGEPMKQSAGSGTEPAQVLTRCIWEGSTSALLTNLLQFRVWNGKMFFAPDQFTTMPGFEKIDGLGDGAYAYGTGSFDLSVLTGDRMVSLGASGFKTDDRARVRQAVLDLATKVLERI